MSARLAGMVASAAFRLPSREYSLSSPSPVPPAQRVVEGSDHRLLGEDAGQDAHCGRQLSSRTPMGCSTRVTDWLSLLSTEFS